jgi:putative ABC transport system permease protein
MTKPRPHAAGTANGGVPARRAVIHWSWRLFRREWRQQLLVLALIVVAVGATVVAAAVAVNTPPAANAGFGTAHDLATFTSPGAKLAADIAALQDKYGRVDVIENQARTVPGSIQSYDLRAQNPDGPFGQPMLSLLSGHYPAAANQVALTPGLAATLGLKIGDAYRQGAQARTVVGIVQNPQSLLDEFALVIPGQVTNPSAVSVLFDAPPGTSSSALGPNVQTPGSQTASNPLNPTTIVLALATIGMLLIALVSVGGFTVLAQRRLRALGMLGALGATDRNIRLVVRANGVVVGVVGALGGLVVGLAAWLAYRPQAEQSAHHLIGVFALPWVVIGPALALAVLATFFAASRPARAITRMSTVAALSGRPAPPKQVHRSALPGVVFAVIAVLALWYSGKSSNGGGAPELVGGLVCLVVSVILLSPLFLAAMARAAKAAPIAARLALRDLGRYRARSGSALAAIALGVMIAMLVCVLSAARYSNVLDYAGPNLSSSQLVVYAPNGGPGGNGGGGNGGGGNGGTVTGGDLQSAAATADSIGAALGSHDVIALETTSASLQHAAPGRQWSGPVYVATPQLLAAFGIKAAQVSPDADILSMRPGLSGLSLMQLTYGNYGNGPGDGQGNGQNQTSFPCPAGQCLANPVIQQEGALPSGTSAPNTVITEHGISQLGLGSSVSTSGWLILAPHPLTAAQITSARLTAAGQGLSIETKSSAPSSAEILNWATLFGFVLALGIVAMSVGLIRSETAGDLRTLTATGASGWTRRTLTAVTAGALGLAGAVLGTAAAYLGAAGYSFGNHLDGLGELGSVPTWNLLVILVGLPLVAAAAGWLLAGREPSTMARQPLE